MIQKIEETEHRYLRYHKKFPNVWCPGCSDGIILGSMIRAIHRLGLEKDEVVMISGIGCAGRMPVYVDFNTMHTTHGRALAFATGVKLARPELKVIVILGDGDGLAIGGNHFIHAARRNIDITALVINNFNYGMTGGQFSPTTPLEGQATTSPYGQIERPFDICSLAQAAGAIFVARGTSYHVFQLDRLIEKAISKKGFSVVEIISHCHTAYGKLNKLGSSVDMLKWERDHAVPVEKAAKASPDEMGGKFATGILKNIEAPEYTEEYQKIIEKAQKEGGLEVIGFAR